MPRTPVEKLIPRGDTLLVRSFPKVARHLNPKQLAANRSGMEAYLKLLPGAIERLQAVTTQTNDLHESVEIAISNLVTSFGSRNASAVESTTQLDTSNTSAELEETAGGVSEPGLPNGSDTSQANSSNSLPHSDLAAEPGNGGESDSAQADPHNPRVSKRGRSQGRRPRVLSRQASGDTANNRG